MLSAKRAILLSCLFATVTTLAGNEDCENTGPQAIEAKLQESLTTAVETHYPEAKSPKAFADVVLSLKPYLQLRESEIKDLYLHSGKAIPAHRSGFNWDRPFSLSPATKADDKIIANFRTKYLQDINWATIVFKDDSIHIIGLAHPMGIKLGEEAITRVETETAAPFININASDDNGDETISVGETILKGTYLRVKDPKAMIEQLGLDPLHNVHKWMHTEVNGKKVCVHFSRVASQHSNKVATAAWGEKTGRK